MNNAYAAFAARRLVQALVVILLAYVFTFVVVSILPGDPITNVLRDPQNGFSEDEIRQIIAAQGLDQPVLVQLWTSLTRFLTGDFGLSMRSSRPVGTLIAEVLPSTLILASSGFAVALVLATGIAYGTQLVPKRYGQGLLRGFPSLFLSVPNFVIGLVLIHLFGFQLGLFRVIAPNSFWATVFAAIALGIPVSAQIAEVLIANLDHERAQDYAAVARSRGLGPFRLFARHLLKPSSLPVVTIIALTLGELLGGSLITETVFGRTGIGSLVQRSVSTQDLPVLQAVVSLAAVVFVLVNLLADLVYPLLDPRVKLVGAASRRPTTADDGASQAVTP
ncbi:MULTISPECIES: ABC transporter permease [Bradyrhizobium]|jgi:peptide/nickel transport system permease protein|uniref:ABC transporter permease n=6 Tax=Bradyrhizobium TaxID=374 RepID=A0ABS5FZT0_9BRAD|nr:MULTISPECIES: ABC transporter permease [Bradyrhizobium]RTM04295.1 MAG: ABC transporter permease [Bradyrhizobiaceae bacterium]ABQ36857.1 putative ABC transporter (permease protein) [Bradyrhizobium sp. BTAi1]MBR1134549.1 ABC transporter permease [Bradyrhizobium denitrificans]MCL8486993.1 ABC transporter permease [Bradyrhizobium denitrificans]MDU1491963.1 ABC transporter permease [Bradyrhizobium sp.]